MSLWHKQQLKGEKIILKKLANIFEHKKRALIIGIGGGADVVSTLPIRRYLQTKNINSFIGGVAWQWAWTVDPKPGPRSINEIINCQKISETVAIVDSKTFIPRTRGEYPELIISKLYNTHLLLIDITKGVKGIVYGLETAINYLGCDLFIGVDAGGDVLETGKERGIRSPEADSAMLAAMTKLETPSLLAVVGLGLDGELTLQEIRRNYLKCKRHGGYYGSYRLTSQDLQFYRECIDNGIKTGVGALILEAARGVRKSFIKSDKPYPVEISSLATRILFFNPKVVFNYVNEISRIIENTTHFDEINRAIFQLGIKPMQEREKEFLAKSEKIPL
jgi:hypothetical protein